MRGEVAPHMQFLRTLDGWWERVLWLLMAAAALYIGMIMVMIIYTTVFRTFGWSYSPYANISIEYGFIYILFLGSPWLVRQRGHIYIEILTAFLPPRPRRVLSRIIVASCTVICFIWVWYSWKLFAEQAADPMAYDELRAQFDIRSWIGTIAFPVGFFLMGVEFARFMFTQSPMHEGIAGVASERKELEEHQRNLTAGR